MYSRVFDWLMGGVVGAIFGVGGSLFYDLYGGDLKNSYYEYKCDYSKGEGEIISLLGRMEKLKSSGDIVSNESVYSEFNLVVERLARCGVKKVRYYKGISYCLGLGVERDIRKGRKILYEVLGDDDRVRTFIFEGNCS
ncbi:hypothetical protein [uncultured Roseibium sp.]|uniref:hypothetical protein n=1 Tax=uncultured Roseibium sp. TaxID=1936171 RepID=UPI0032162DF7